MRPDFGGRRNQTKVRKPGKRKRLTRTRKRKRTTGKPSLYRQVATERVAPDDLLTLIRYYFKIFCFFFIHFFP